MKSSLKIIILALIFGTLSGALAAFLLINFNSPSQEELIKDFYQTENAVHVSPHHIRKAMSKGESNFILVDLRSDEEYEKEHVLGAINIPAYKDPNTSAYSDVERIVGEFKKLSKDKDIIVYCYSIPCMTGRKVGKMLAEEGIFVKHLGVGWNEWRHFWSLWNHEHEWEQVKVEDYIAKGKEPGVPKINPDDITPCSVDGEFGC